MSNVIDDQTLTDGVKVENPLRGDSCFFIEASTVFNQTADIAFGPKSTDEFKTTSKITFSGDKNIYAICEGLMLIQPQLDVLGNPTSLVNVIIKPVVQPIQGLAIKYFVYRGLNKSDFVSGNQIPATGTQFINDLNNEFNGTTFLAKYIGLPTTSTELEDFPDTMLIDELFYNKSTFVNETENEIQEDPAKAFQVPYVSKGDCIGTADGSLGIDIVLDSIDTIGINGDNAPFKLDLKFARSADHKLDLDVVGLTDFQKKLIREASCQFMDVASYLGFHANGYGKLYLDGNTNTDEATNHISTTADIYGKMSGFATKNTTYVTVMGHRGRSYNFYDQHSPEDDTTENIKIGLDEEALTHKTYGTFGWPVEVFNPSSITDVSDLKIRLVSNSKETKVYILLGKVSAEDRIKYIDRLHEDLGGYSQLIELGVSSYLDRIGQHCIIVYSGSNLKAKLSPIVEGEEKEFIISDLNNVINISNDSAISLLDDVSPNVQKRYVVKNINFVNKDFDFSVATCEVVEDFIKTPEGEIKGRVTFGTMLCDTNRKNEPVFLSNEQNQVASSKVFDLDSNNFHKPDSKLRLVKEFCQYQGQYLQTVYIEDLFGENPLNYYMGLTKEEAELLINNISINSLNNVSLYFHDNLRHQIDSSQLTEFNLSLLGENSSGGLVICQLNSSLKIYTKDNIFYHSLNYARTFNVIEDIVNGSERFIDIPVFEETEVEEEIPSPSFGLIESDGAILKSGIAVDISEFDNVKYDSGGFLKSFTENGKKYVRAIYKHRFKLTNLEYTDHKELVDNGFFVKEYDFIYHMNKPLGMPFLKLIKEQYQFKELESNSNKTIIVIRAKEDYQDNKIRVQKLKINNHLSSNIPYTGGIQYIDESLFAIQSNNLIVKLDNYSEGFRTRIITDTSFTSLTDDEKKSHYHIIQKIVFKMSRFDSKLKSILYSQANNDSEIISAISSMQLYWRDNLIFENRDILDNFNNVLNRFNKTIYKYKYEFEDIEIKNILGLLFSITNPSQLIVMSTENKLNGLAYFIFRDELTDIEQLGILNVLKSFSYHTDDGINELLDFLLNPSSDNKTVFERLYYLMSGVSLYSALPLYSFIAESFFEDDGIDNNDRNNRTFRHQFVSYLFELWFNSKYNPYDLLGQEKGEDSFFKTEEGAGQLEPIDLYFRINSSGAIDNKKVHQYESNGKIKDYREEVTYLPSKQMSGNFIDIYELHKAYEIDSYSGADILAGDEKILSKNLYASYHLYHPLKAVGFTPTYELVDSFLLSYFPAFLFFFHEDYTRMRNNAGWFAFAVDIVLEVGIFFASGSFSALRTLSRYKKLTPAGKALFSTVDEQVVSITIRNTTIEVAAGVLGATASLIANTTNDADVKRIYDLLGFICFGISLKSAYVQYFVINEDVAVLAKKVTDLYANLSQEQKIVAGITDEMISFLNNLAFDLSFFKQTWLTDNPSFYQNKLNGLTSLEWARFYLDFKVLNDQQKLIHYNKLSENLNGEYLYFDNWRNMLNAGVHQDIRSMKKVFGNSTTDNAVTTAPDIIRIYNKPAIKQKLDKWIQFETGTKKAQMHKIIEEVLIKEIASYTDAELELLNINPACVDLYISHALHASKADYQLIFPFVGSKVKVGGFKSIKNFLKETDDTLPRFFKDIIIERSLLTVTKEVDKTSILSKLLKNNTIHQTATKPLIHEMYNRFRGVSYSNIDSNKAKYNLMDVRMSSNLDNEISVTLVSGSKSSIRNTFKHDGGGTLMPYTVRGMYDSQYNTLGRLKDYGFKANNKFRAFETETKLLIWMLDNFGIANSIPKHFYLEIDSLFHMCQSCQALIPIIKKVMQSYGHTVTIKVTSNTQLMNTTNVRTYLNLPDN